MAFTPPVCFSFVLGTGRRGAVSRAVGSEASGAGCGGEGDGCSYAWRCIYAVVMVIMFLLMKAAANRGAVVMQW